MLYRKQDVEEAEILVMDSDGEVIEAPPPAKPPRRFALPRLPHFQDEGQSRAFRNILRFLAFILIVTIVARGTAGATMARVRTQAPGPGEITRMVSATGTVEAAHTNAIELPAGVTIERVLVVPGQNVKEGDGIAKLDTNELTELLAREQLTLDEMELSQSRLERGEPYDGSALINAQNALAWAQEDCEKIRLAGEAAVGRAQGDLDAAKANAALPEGERDPNALAVESAERALQDARTTAANSLQTAARSVETAHINLEAAQLADGQKRQTAADAAAQRGLEAKALRLDIANRRQLVERLSVYQTDGVIKSELNGTVLQVAEAGTFLEDTAVATITDNESGYRVRAGITESEARKLAPGIGAEVSSSQGYHENPAQPSATLLSMSEPDPAGMVEALFQLPEGAWQHGENVTVNIIEHRDTYAICLPLSALHRDQEGTYVFVMDSASGVMGAENVLRAVPVEVEAQDGGMAAVTGALSGYEQVVVWSSKPVVAQDKVRVETA